MKIPDYISANGEVKDGRLKVYKSKEFAELIRVYEGKQIEVKVSRKHSHRSLQQNAYFHAILPFIREALKDTGNIMTVEDIKIMLKSMFLKQDIVDSEGTVMGQRIRGTHELNKVEFGEFMSDCNHWCIEYLSCEIPKPGEELEIKYN